ncbi:MAG: hypothetical protein RR744_10510 [Cellulosilyticaceae bacterium]
MKLSAMSITEPGISMTINPNYPKAGNIYRDLEGNVCRVIAIAIDETYAKRTLVVHRDIKDYSVQATEMLAFETSREYLGYIPLH